MKLTSLSADQMGVRERIVTDGITRLMDDKTRPELKPVILIDVKAALIEMGFMFPAASPVTEKLTKQPKKTKEKTSVLSKG